MQFVRHLIAGGLCIGVTMVPATAIAQDSIEIVIEPAPLVITGAPEPHEFVIDVDGLVIVGAPDAKEFVIDVGELVIVGAPETKEITIDVTELVIVGKREDSDEPDGQADQVTQDDPQNTSDTGDDLNMTTNEADTPDQEDQIGGSGTTGDSPDRPGTWCNGTYAVTLGQPRFVPAGPPIGRVETASAQVTTSQCTATMTVTVAGGTVAMARNGGQHVGSTIAPEGQKVTYTLTCQPDLSISGYLVASDSAITIQRDIEMRRTGGAEANLTGCPAGTGY